MADRRGSLAKTQRRQEEIDLTQALTAVPAEQRTRLVARACEVFALPPASIHGPSHWLRVRENGLRLATATGVNCTVVELFALFHDSMRRSDGRDLDHGRRAAELLRALREPLVFLPEVDFEHLLYACTHHTAGWTEAPLMVQICWDADRLDLGRAGILPMPEKLCTPAAREPDLLAWAYARSCPPNNPYDGLFGGEGRGSSPWKGGDG